MFFVTRATGTQALRVLGWFIVVCAALTGLVALSGQLPESARIYHETGVRQ